MREWLGRQTLDAKVLHDVSSSLVIEDKWGDSARADTRFLITKVRLASRVFDANRWLSLLPMTRFIIAGKRRSMGS
jgi:hypothetical protein